MSLFYCGRDAISRPTNFGLHVLRKNTCSAHVRAVLMATDAS